MTQPTDIMKKLNLTVEECEKLYKGAMNTERNYIKYVRGFVKDRNNSRDDVILKRWTKLFWFMFISYLAILAIQIYLIIELWS